MLFRRRVSFALGMAAGAKFSETWNLQRMIHSGSLENSKQLQEMEWSKMIAAGIHLGVGARNDINAALHGIAIGIALVNSVSKFLLPYCRTELIALGMVSNAVFVLGWLIATIGSVLNAIENWLDPDIDPGDILRQAVLAPRRIRRR